MAKSIGVTDEEFALISEAKELFTGFTKTKISWGAYLCALSLGGLAAKASIGIVIKCPECSHEVAIKLASPRPLHRKSRQSQRTG